MKSMLFLLAAACFADGASARQASGTTAQDQERSAVEAAVRRFEQAVQEFDRKKANAVITPDARWIENSLPVKFDDEWQLVQLRAIPVSRTSPSWKARCW